MSIDKQGKYQHVPSTSAEDNFEINDETSYPLEGINNLKNSFPKTPSSYGYLIGIQKKLIIYICSLIIIILIGILFLRFNKPPRLPITMDDLNQGLFYPNTESIKFLNPEYPIFGYNDEGLYYSYDQNSIKAYKIEDSKFNITIVDNLKFIYSDKQYEIVSIVPNLNLTYSIIITDKVAKFRHSSEGYYWIMDHSNNNIITPLSPDEELTKISFASWSPNYNYISFVKKNNVYIMELSTLQITQVTFDGSDRLFYGKTDWVYEEEVMSTDKALWWSPDEQKLIFLKLDDSLVDQYNLEYYYDDERGYNINWKHLNYPKPGTPNPKASLHIYSIFDDSIYELDRSDSTLGFDFIIYDAIFLDSNVFIIKETDRKSKILEFRKYLIDSKKSCIFHRIDSELEFNGWIEKQNKMLLIPLENNVVGFVDVQNVKGYNHLIYFESLDSPPIELTSGNWEVNKDSLSYNWKTKEVYYFSNEGFSMNQNLYGVNINSKEKEKKFQLNNDGFYSGIFSNFGKYLQLNYEGPKIPYSIIYNLETNSSKLNLTTTTTFQTNLLQLYKVPTKKLYRIKVDNDVELNVIETKPFDFDPKRKYPLLVHHYSGPGSQVVFNKFEIGFEETICSSLNAIILYIEPRGTGGQGWLFRSWSKRKIGYWEPRDLKKITEKWINKENSFIDKNKVAIWGWSYGGFTTLNTLQFDAGEVFKYGIAVAPVTDWRLYDSIYTERYMDKPEENMEGYEISQINQFENLAKVKRFLIMHGSADDNVHLQNTMIMIDQFNLKGLTNYEMKIFPDSDHSISFHNANPIIYNKIFNWLKDAFDGNLDLLNSKK